MSASVISTFWVCVYVCVSSLLLSRVCVHEFVDIDSALESAGAPAVACSSNTVCIAQHCDNRGWKKGFVPEDGMILKAPRAGGSDFANDASYITTPAGWQATVMAYPLRMRVDQSTHFSFCSQGGFNDNVSEIRISRVGPPPTAAPKQPSKVDLVKEKGDKDEKKDDVHGVLGRMVTRRRV